MPKRNKITLTKTHPGLLREWDFSKNKIKPEDVTFGSDKKIWWVCVKCAYSWEATVYNRTKNKSGCPACAGMVLTDINRLSIRYPKISKEWDYGRNYPLTPKEVFKGTHKKVWWLCSKCGYGWKSSITNRTYGKNGFPKCAGKIITGLNSLYKLHPEVSSEWDEKRNSFLTPEQFLPGSHKKVWWKCRKCEYRWKAIIKNRTRKEDSTGCPGCGGNVVIDSNRLSINNTRLSSEWDCKKNFPLTTEDVAVSSNKKVWWKCSTCNHGWAATVNNRTRRGSGCPHCSIGPVSSISQKWLSSLNIMSKCREVRVNLDSKYCKVDGFDSETNTVYEFLGNYWHGNPNMFPAEEINPTTKKTYGSLYVATVNRFNSLLNAGYSAVYIWESDFHSNKKETTLTPEEDYPINSL